MLTMFSDECEIFINCPLAAAKLFRQTLFFSRFKASLVILINLALILSQMRLFVMEALA